MDVTDILFAGVSDAADEAQPPASDGPERAAGEERPAETDRLESGQVWSALDKLRRSDASRWMACLAEAGFSRAEAQRLIFERTRPRDEGTVRS
jgi:hypothetical protein